MSKPASSSGFTINPTVASGYIISASVVSYAQAQAGTGVNFSASADGSYTVGQQFVPADTYSPDQWLDWVSFMDFDLASVTGTVASATLSLGLAVDTSTTDFTIEVRTKDWGASLTTADWVVGASIGALTLLASLSTSGIGSFGYKVLTESGTSLKDAVVAAGSGVLRCLVCSSRFRTVTTPTGDEFVEFSTYNSATKPKLVIATA
jgi:hypothetical protein